MKDFSKEELLVVRDLFNVSEKYSEKIHFRLRKLIIKFLDSCGLDVKEEDVTAGLKEGKLQSIKSYKYRTGCSLIESKDAIENYFKENGLNFYGQ